MPTQEIINISQEIKEVYDRAIELGLGLDLGGYTLCDLAADNLPYSTADIREAVAYLKQFHTFPEGV